MNTPRAIQNFPKSYRAKEMRILAQWLRAGESGSVVGLPGCGRNNLLNFLCYRPDVLREEYLGSETDAVAIIPVDLIHLPINDAATLYRVILRAFYWMRHQLPDTLKDSVTTLYLENRATQDPFLAQSALYEMLLAFQAEAMRVALVLNRFDHFCRQADPRLFIPLRGLRDSFKDILSFIVGMHREIIYLTDPQRLGEMYTLLDNNTCWIGPMSEADAYWVIKQVLHAIPEAPGEAEIQEILALSGGIPTLLRFVTGWWLKQAPKPPLDQWLHLLSREPLFDHRLKELWNSLTQEEQTVLETISKGTKRTSRISPEHQQILLRLAIKGVCQQTGQSWQIGSKLWADFIGRQETSRGKLVLNEQTEVISQGLKPIRLAPQENTLLRYLLKHPYQRHPYENIILEIWPGDHDPPTQKQALFQLVRSIRGKIEPNSTEPRYLVNWTDQQDGGYQLFPEGQPL